MCFGFKKYITLLLSLSTLEHICNALLRKQTTIIHTHSVCSVKQIKWTPPKKKRNNNMKCKQNVRIIVFL